MFFSSGSGAASPHKQPLLSSPTAKKTTSSRFRNLLFHSLEPEEDDSGSHSAAAARKAPAKAAANASNNTITSSSSSINNNQAKEKDPAKLANPRDTFQRSNSHPIRLDASAALSASRSYDPSMSRAAAIEPAMPQLRASLQPPPQQQPPSIRSAVFGSCSLVLSAVITALFQTVTTSGKVIDAAEDPGDAASDNSTLRRAKLLYIALLEKAQRDRGEWQGFASSDDNNSKDGEETAVDSTYGLLAASVENATVEEAFAVLHELLALSFRNLRVALLPPLVYSKHRSELESESLQCPPSLATLLRVSRFLKELSLDEKSCLLRLLSLWVAICTVDSTRSLRVIVEEKHALILSEASEMEFMQQAARKSARIDHTAVDLLVLMAQYRDVLFPELELYAVRQEMQVQSPSMAKEDTENQAPETGELDKDSDTTSVLPVDAEIQTAPLEAELVLDTVSTETQTDESSLNISQQQVMMDADWSTTMTEIIAHGDNESGSETVAACDTTSHHKQACDSDTAPSIATRKRALHRRALAKLKPPLRATRKATAPPCFSPLISKKQHQQTQAAPSSLPVTASNPVQSAAIISIYAPIAIAALCTAAAAGLYAMRKSGA